MKKYFTVTLILIALSACSVENKNSIVSATTESDGYHEYETNLTWKEVEGEMLPSTAAEKEKERLIKAGAIFWGSEKTVDGFELMKIYDIKKPWPEDALDVYSYGNTMYYLYRIKDKYGIYEDKKLLFAKDMLFGGAGPVHDWKIVLDKPAFTFTEFKGYVNGPEEKEGPRKSAYNTWYKNETMNEKYKLDGSYYLFSYKNKLGFVAIKDEKKYIFFNGQKVSSDFDEIRTYSCCAIMPYPFKIDDNGILFFMGKRGEKYFLTEVDLNKHP